MAVRAGEMHSDSCLILPPGSIDDDEVADFIIKTVDRYIEENSNVPFYEYAEEALYNEYGHHRYV